VKKTLFPPQRRKGAKVSQRETSETEEFLCVFFASLRLCGGFSKVLQVQGKRLFYRITAAVQKQKRNGNDTGA
jgi:hypothetical protein